MNLRTQKIPLTILITIIIILISTIAISYASQPISTPGTEIWTGNGSENNCQNGGTYHWILSAGGGHFDYVSAKLYVTYTNGSSSVSNGYFPGGSGHGAMHFSATGGKVASAYAIYTYQGSPGNIILTISSSVCEVTTTTTVPQTTTTTTEEETTTTTVAPTTTTTEEETTTTTTEQETTTTTVVETTTTLPEVTTTTVEESTTTTLPEVTTTTVTQPTTTTSEVVTTTTLPEVTTTTIPETTTTSIPGEAGITTTTSTSIPQSTTTTTIEYPAEFPFTGFNLPMMLIMFFSGLALIGMAIWLYKADQ